MQLGDYLAAERLTLTAFGRRIGVAHSTVHKWATGRLLPAWDKIMAIESATGGAVTAEDFAELARGAKSPPGGMRSVRKTVAADKRGEPCGGIELPGALLRQARAHNVDVTAVCCAALSQAVRAARAAEWREENRAAIEAHSRYVEEHGLPLGKHRMF